MRLISLTLERVSFILCPPCDPDCFRIPLCRRNSRCRRTFLLCRNSHNACTWNKGVCCVFRSFSLCRLLEIVRVDAGVHCAVLKVNPSVFVRHEVVSDNAYLTSVRYSDLGLALFKVDAYEVEGDVFLTLTWDETASLMTLLHKPSDDSEENGKSGANLRLLNHIPWRTWIL